MNGTDMIRDYARMGVRLKLEEMQFVLEQLYHDFPEEFTQKPQIVAVRLAPVNGHRRRSARRRQPVTTLTRNADGADARLVRAVGQVNTSKPGKPWGALAWQRIHDYLAKQPKMTARATDIRKAVKVSDPMVYSIIEKRPDLFERPEPGVFRLKQKAHG